MQAHESDEVGCDHHRRRRDDGQQLPAARDVRRGHGTASRRHAEVLHVNVIARRTITVDGNLDDWQGVIPQTGAQTGGRERDREGLPALPATGAVRSGGGSVTAWLAGGRAGLLLRRQGAADGRHCIRYETRDDDDFFYPEKVTSQGKELTVARRACAASPTARTSTSRPATASTTCRSPSTSIPPEKKAYVAAFPPGTMPRFCSYFDTDHEFALNKVGERWGGGTEIFRLHRSGDDAGATSSPRQPKAPYSWGAGEGGSRSSS